LNRLEFGHIKLNSQYQEPNYWFMCLA
jgi:hypothetical protein